MPISIPTDPFTLSKVGTSVIGGDKSGGTRGANAIDIQASHALGRVASGINSIAIGAGASASANCISIGSSVNNTSAQSIAVGNNSNCSNGLGQIAIGYNAIVLPPSGASPSTVVGSNSTVNGQYSTVIGASSFGVRNFETTFCRGASSVDGSATTVAYSRHLIATTFTPNGTPKNLLTFPFNSAIYGGVVALDIKLIGQQYSFDVTNVYFIKTYLKVDYLTQAMTLAASPVVNSFIETTGMAYTLGLSGSNMLIGVSGQAGQHINWTAELSFVEMLVTEV